MRFKEVCFLTCALATFAGSQAATLSITTPGWNLLGYSDASDALVADAFGNANNVVSVWKWNAATSRWAFYSPALSGGGQAYALDKGYDFLTTIKSGDGFWVNAKANFSATLPAAAAFPLNTAYTQALTTSNSFSGTAVDGADTWTVAISITPASDQLFEGIVSKRANQTLTLKKNGVTAIASSIENYFTLNPYSPRGAKYSDGSYAAQTSAASALPNDGVVGNSGSFGTLTLYSNSLKSSVVLTQDGTWTLEADTASTAYGCINSVAKNTAGAAVSTSSGCYKIDTTGAIKGIRWTLMVEGKTLVFR